VKLASLSEARKSFANVIAIAQHEPVVVTGVVGLP